MRFIKKPYTGPTHSDDPTAHYFRESNKLNRLYLDKNAFNELYMSMRDDEGESGRKARSEIIEGCQGMVIRWAKWFSGRFPFLDLVQEGNIGLIRGLERYNPEMGVRPSTYLDFWIKSAIIDHMRDNTGAYRLNERLQKKILQYRELLELMAETPERAQEIGQQINETFTEYDLRAIRDNAFHASPLNLDDPFADDKREFLGPVSNDYLPEDEASENQFNDILDELLSDLDTWERVYFEDIVINGLNPREVAERYMDDPERVKSYIEKAKRKLRRHPMAKELKRRNR